MDREELKSQLRDYARALYRKTGNPISTNDVRHLIPEGMDQRILGRLFSAKEGWREVGREPTEHKNAWKYGNTGFRIRLYVPEEK